MSADTPEGREAETNEALAAIQKVVMERAGWAEVPALSLARGILAALPPSCDFDCDACRE